MVFEICETLKDVCGECTALTNVINDKAADKKTRDLAKEALAHHKREVNYSRGLINSLKKASEDSYRCSNTRAQKMLKHAMVMD